MKRVLLLLSLIMILVFSIATVTTAQSFDSVLARWSQSKRYVEREDKVSNLTITATYYSAEYIEAFVQNEAKKNLWTENELEEYKYNFVKALRLDETIPILLHIDNNGPAMYLSPLDIFAKLRIGKNTYKPIDYDKRLNFKLLGEREGLIFFPRTDAKTGKDLLKGEKYVTFELPPSISPVVEGRETAFMWNVADDDPKKLFAGKTADKMETDRLLKRLEKLKKDKKELDSQLQTVNSEIGTIQTRLDELMMKK